MRILLRWLVTILALFVAVWLVPGIDIEGNAWVAVGVTAAILGLLNAFIKPVLQFLSCGCVVLTLGLFLLVINAGVLWFSSYAATEWFGVGFYVDGFWAAFWGGLIVSVISFVADLLLPDGKDR